MFLICFVRVLIAISLFLALLCPETPKMPRLIQNFGFIIANIACYKARMSTLSIDQAKDAIYQSLANDNEDIDLHIGNLKAALSAAGEKEAEFEADKLSQNNRAGRKMMQSYFKKRGVKVVFAK